jgi:hypothetical protein
LPAWKLFFCHIPKTGGTSLRHALESKLPPSATVPDIAAITLNNGRYPPLAVAMAMLEARAPETRLFRGHYHFGCRRYLPGGFNTLVVLRDPLERNISLFRHMVAYQGKSPESLLEGLYAGSPIGPDNHMTRYLAGALVRQSDGTLSDRHLGEAKVEALQLEQAKAALRGCDFVGLTSDMSPLQERLSDFTRTELAIGRDNESAGPEPRFTPQEMDLLRSHNEIDQRLYDFAKAEIAKSQAARNPVRFPYVSHWLETPGPADERNRPSWYRLDISSSAGKFQIRLGQPTESAIALPLIGPETSYLMRLASPPSPLELVVERDESDNFSPRIRRARKSDFTRLGAAALVRRGVWKIKVLGGSAYLLHASGRLSRPELARLLHNYRERNRHELLARYFEIADLEAAEMFPEIDRDWPCLAPRRSVSADRAEAPADIAIYIHLFFADQWPDFCHRLSGIDVPFDLHISVPDHRPELEEQIREAFPRVAFHLCGNRGRDIWPFVELFQRRVFDRYVAVCKLHTKKSGHLHFGESQPDFGKRWRRSALLELIGTTERVAGIADRFRSDPTAGIVGPSNLWVDEPPDSEGWGTRKNRATMISLAQRLRMPESSIRNNFFAGTMFWFRPLALEGVAAGRFSASDFEPEPLPQEGALPHSFERIFNLLAESAGFEILGSRDV